MNALIELLTGLDLKELSVIAGAILAPLAAALFGWKKKREGRREGRAEIRQQNAEEAARQHSQLNEIREKQAQIAANRPDDDELHEKLEKGKF